MLECKAVPVWSFTSFNYTNSAEFVEQRYQILNVSVNEYAYMVKCDKPVNMTSSVL